MTNRRGLVRIDGKNAGSLKEFEDGFEFAYLATWLGTQGARPISLTMPLRTEPYVSRNLHPFFQNLLPEGWLLELATKKLKVSKDDAFGLLLATCADCIGATEILAISQAVES